MKRITCLALVGVIIALGFASKRVFAQSEVKIGVVLPLSGSMAEYGLNGKEGLTLALEELSKSEGSKRLSLIYQDTKEAPQDTVSAVRRLIDVDNVQFIIGGLTSSGVLAAAPYAQQRGVLFFTPAASAPGIPEIGDLVFRNWPADDAMSKKYGEAAAKILGVHSVAILSVSNDYGNTNANGFASSFEAAGGRVLLRRSFSQGTTDFKTFVAQAAALKGLDHLLIIGYPDEYRAFFQEITKTDIKPSIVLTSDTFYSPGLVGELGKSAEGVICAVAAKPSDDYKQRSNFINSYRARFRGVDGKPKSPGLVSDTAYDALRLISSGINNTDGSAKSVAKYLLEKVKNYPGAAGITTFTEVGDVVGEPALYQVKEGKFVKLGQ